MAMRLKNVDRETPMLLPPDMRDWLPEDHNETTLQSLESERRLASGHGTESDRRLKTMRWDRVASAKPGSFFQKHSRSGKFGSARVN